MQWLNRLKIELKELEEKKSKLKKFIEESEEFQNLDIFNKELLIEQRYFMERYILVLKERISINQKEKK